MKAAFLHAREDVRIGELDLPPVESHALIIRVLGCGICGSDARMFFNGPSSRYTIPVILGHELSGEVVEVGPRVEGYAPGDLVTVAPIAPCMRCPPCSRGMDNLCERAQVIGCTVHGGMAEYLYVSSQMVQVGGVVRLPPGVDHRTAAMSELVGCCLHGLRQTGVRAGDRLLIVGDGPIGLTFLQLAKLMGAGWVAT
ncbi:MAG: alcohol dehydrogenase catalytic domain-containing protein, partial [Anaerolineae bacterium]|nr:alcohol dehydrogenase catalytic domain-containing protein [Anaerolineae bacterium]